MGRWKQRGVTALAVIVVTCAIGRSTSIAKGRRQLSTRTVLDVTIGGVEIDSPVVDVVVHSHSEGRGTRRRYRRAQRWREGWRRWCDRVVIRDIGHRQDHIYSEGNKHRKKLSEGTLTLGHHGRRWRSNGLLEDLGGLRPIVLARSKHLAEIEVWDAVVSGQQRL